MKHFCRKIEIGTNVNIIRETCFAVFFTHIKSCFNNKVFFQSLSVCIIVIRPVITVIEFNSHFRKYLYLETLYRFIKRTTEQFVNMKAEVIIFSLEKMLEFVQLISLSPF